MKCVICHCHFEPTAEERRMRLRPDVSADFPYCSLECAKADKSNAWRKGKFPRDLYHVGAKDPAPTFGVWTEIRVDASLHGDGKEKRIVTVRKNIGGIMKIRPYTPEMRAQQARMRGRSTFGEGCTVLVLPSAKFYNAKTNKSHLANDRHN